MLALSYQNPGHLTRIHIIHISSTLPHTFTHFCARTLLTQGFLGAPVRLPIFVDSSYNASDFNMPVDPNTNSSLPYNCSICFGARRFWGVSAG